MNRTAVDDLSRAAYIRELLGRIGVGQGLAFGFGDEIAALYRSQIGDEDYDVALDDERARVQALRDRDPWGSTAAEIGGGALMGGASALGLNAARGLGAVGRSASALAQNPTALGAAEGALYGLGVGEGGAERIGGAAAGGVLGAGVAKATQALGGGGYEAIANRRAASRALSDAGVTRPERQAISALQRAGVPLDDLSGAINSAAGSAADYPVTELAMARQLPGARHLASDMNEAYLRAALPDGQARPGAAAVYNRAVNRDFGADALEMGDSVARAAGFDPAALPAPSADKSMQRISREAALQTVGARIDDAVPGRYGFSDGLTERIDRVLSSPGMDVASDVFQREFLSKWKARTPEEILDLAEQLRAHLTRRENVRGVTKEFPEYLSAEGIRTLRRVIDEVEAEARAAAVSPGTRALTASRAAVLGEADDSFAASSIPAVASRDSLEGEAARRAMTQRWRKALLSGAEDPDYRMSPELLQDAADPAILARLQGELGGDAAAALSSEAGSALRSVEANRIVAGANPTNVSQPVSRNFGANRPGALRQQIFARALKAEDRVLELLAGVPAHEMSRALAAMRKAAEGRPLNEAERALLSAISTARGQSAVAGANAGLSVAGN